MIPAHPIAELFPAMDADAFAALKADIAERGLLEPVWLYVHDGGPSILDGRHRARACEELGIAFASRQYEGDDPLAFVLSLNLHRRHLEAGQRAMVAARLANLPVGWRGVSTDTPSREQAAALLGVGPASVGRARRVQRDGAPELVDAVDAGAVSVDAAVELSTLPKDEQAAVVAKGPAAVKERASQLRSRNGEERAAIVRKHAEAGLTARQIAEKVGVSAAYVLRIAKAHGITLYQTGRRMRPDIAKAIADQVAELEVLASALRFTPEQYQAVPQDEAVDYAKSLGRSLSVIRSFHTSLKARANDESQQPGGGATAASSGTSAGRDVCL